MNESKLSESIKKLYKKYNYASGDFSIEPTEISDLLGTDCADGCDRDIILVKLEYLFKNYPKEKIEKYLQKEKKKRE